MSGTSAHIYLTVSTDTCTCVCSGKLGEASGRGHGQTKGTHTHTYIHTVSENFTLFPPSLALFSRFLRPCSTLFAPLSPFFSAFFALFAPLFSAFFTLFAPLFTYHHTPTQAAQQAAGVATQKVMPHTHKFISLVSHTHINYTHNTHTHTGSQEAETPLRGLQACAHDRRRPGEREGGSEGGNALARGGAYKRVRACGYALPLNYRSVCNSVIVSCLVGPLDSNKLIRAFSVRLFSQVKLGRKMRAIFVL